MVEEVKSSNRNRIIILAVGALAFACIALGAVLFFILSDSGEVDKGGTAEAAKLMPADTFMFFTFNPHLDQAEHFDVIDKAWRDSLDIDKGLADLLDSMQEGGLDYKAEIEPWLGDEIAFGMGSNFLTAMEDAIDDVYEQIGESLSGGYGQAPSAALVDEIPEFTIAIATKDKAASERFLDKLRAKSLEDGDYFEETEYNGFKIVYQESEMAYATIDDFIILTAGGLEPMQAIIDRRDGDNLAEDPDFKNILAKLPADQIGYGYMDIGAYMETVLGLAGPELEQLPSEIFSPEFFKAFKGAGLSIGLEPNGLRVDVVSTFDSDAFPENYPWPKTTAGKSVQYVPDDTLFYLAGGGLGDALNMILDMVAAMPDQAEDFEEQMGMLTSMLGITVEDLVKMLSGEFALAITHYPDGIAGDPSVPIGVSVLIEAKEKGTFENFIQSISGLLAMSGLGDMPKEIINGVEVTTIQDPYSGSMVVGWGVGDDFFALGTNEELLEAAFGGGGAVLADNDTYKKATAPLPKDKSTILYVNVEKLIDIVVENMSPWERESFEENARDMLSPIKAISMAAESYDQNSDSTSATIFILIESE